MNRIKQYQMGIYTSPKKQRGAFALGLIFPECFWGLGLGAPSSHRFSDEIIHASSIPHRYLIHTSCPMPEVNNWRAGEQSCALAQSAGTCRELGQRNG